MKTVSLIFIVHQPLKLRTYRFFDMGRSHDYLDDAANRSIMQRVAASSYLPMNELLLKAIKANKGKFKVSFYISGMAMEQFRSYAPEVMEGFRSLARTGHVEFIAGTYSNSLSSIINREEFAADVRLHTETLEKEFGATPASFCNTALLYSDTIGDMVADMGFRAMITEGAKHVLGWKSPDYVYANALNQKLRLLLRNNRLSDDIAFRFSDRDWAEWPLTAEKFAGWIADGGKGETVNICLDYDSIGEWQKAESGIFDFMASLPKAVLRTGKLKFGTPSEAAAEYQPAGILHSNHPITWADEERDISAWLGNELQNEAFDKLYRQYPKVRALADPAFDHPWRFLQTANHFYYMGTKWFSAGDLQSNYNPYPSSYEAFINYMNILSDFIIELDRAVERKSGGKSVPCTLRNA